MKDEDYVSIAAAIKRKLLSGANLSRAESEALKRQLAWIESLRNQPGKKVSHQA